MDSPANRIDWVRRCLTGLGGKSAYTILETMVGISVFLFILFGVYLVYDTSQATFLRAEARASIQQEARSAMEEMRRELRMAGYDPSATGQAAVQNPTSTSLEFITDADDNNISDLVRYDGDATTKTIRRSVRAWTGTGWGTASVTTLATNVDGLAFQYFPSAAMPGLQRVRITIQASETLPRQPIQQQQVITDVFLRNL